MVLHTTMAKSFYKMSEAYCTIMLSSDELAKLHLFSLAAPKGSPGTTYKADWQLRYDLQGWLAALVRPTRLTGSPGTTYKADWQPCNDLQGWLAAPVRPTRLTGSSGTTYKADWQLRYDLQGWLAAPQRPTRLTGRQGPVTSFWQAGILRMVTDDKKGKKKNQWQVNRRLHRLIKQSNHQTPAVLSSDTVCDGCWWLWPGSVPQGWLQLTQPGC